MTYLELYEKATRQLEKSEITLGEYEEMIKPLDKEIIITCKDCKYYREDDDTGHCTNHTCGDITFWCHDDYYCADAERKRKNEAN